MVRMVRWLLIVGTVATLILFSGCTGVYVGVGVHAPGPWAGPYGGPGVSIGTGRPVSPGYYPFKPDNRILAIDLVSETPTHLW